MRRSDEIINIFYKKNIPEDITKKIIDIEKAIELKERREEWSYIYYLHRLWSNPIKKTYMRLWLFEQIKEEVQRRILNKNIKFLLSHINI